MTIHLATNESATGLFNVGSGRARTWIDLANAVFEALSLPPRLNLSKCRSMLRDKYQYFTEANIEKLKATGYSGPKFSLEQAVADYVQNYLVPHRHLEV